MRDFIWFTTHSWTFMEGQRKRFFKEFWSSWRHFREGKDI